MAERHANEGGLCAENSVISQPWVSNASLVMVLLVRVVITGLETERHNALNKDFRTRIRLVYTLTLHCIDALYLLSYVETICALSADVPAPYLACTPYRMPIFYAIYLSPICRISFLCVLNVGFAILI